MYGVFLLYENSICICCIVVYHCYALHLRQRESQEYSVHLRLSAVFVCLSAL